MVDLFLTFSHKFSEDLHDSFQILLLFLLCFLTINFKCGLKNVNNISICLLHLSYNKYIYVLTIEKHQFQSTSLAASSKATPSLEIAQNIQTSLPADFRANYREQSR